jgi:heme/copper-type cytochrome/quinol oxidase subunit 2
MLNLNFYLFLFIFEKKISICFDAAESGQLLFQHPATKIMDNLIDLHHDIFSVMLIIATIVFYLIVVAVLKFRSDNIFTFRNFNFTHNTFLEVF